MTTERKYLPPDQQQKPQDQGFKPLAQSDILAKATELSSKLASKKELKTRKPKRCCGTLPCKGRTPNCYYCSECLDCITGAGCGHDSSTHDPEAHITAEDD